MWLLFSLLPVVAAQLSGKYCLYGLSSPARYPYPITGRLGSPNRATATVAINFPESTAVTGILVNASGNYSYQIGLGPAFPPPESINPNQLVSIVVPGDTSRLQQYTPVYVTDGFPATTKYFTITPAPGTSLSFDILVPCLYSNAFLLGAKDPTYSVSGGPYTMTFPYPDALIASTTGTRYLTGPPANATGYMTVSIQTWPPLSVTRTPVGTNINWAIEFPSPETRIQYLLVVGIPNSCGSQTGAYASAAGICEACVSDVSYQPAAGQTACIPVSVCTIATITRATLTSDAVCYSPLPTTTTTTTRKPVYDANHSSASDLVPTFAFALFLAVAFLIL